MRKVMTKQWRLCYRSNIIIHCQIFILNCRFLQDMKIDHDGIWNYATLINFSICCRLAVSLINLSIIDSNCFVCIKETKMIEWKSNFSWTPRRITQNNHKIIHQPVADVSSYTILTKSVTFILYLFCKFNSETFFLSDLFTNFIQFLKHVKSLIFIPITKA